MVTWVHRDTKEKKDWRACLARMVEAEIPATPGPRETWVTLSVVEMEILV